MVLPAGGKCPLLLILIVMAILKGGVLHGKVGGLVYYVRNGVPCVRAAAKPSTTPPTHAQLAQQQRMKMAIQFLAPLAPVLEDTIKTQVRKKLSGMNWVTKMLLRDAIAGEYPNQYIQPERVPVSRGSLDPLYNPLLELDQNRSFVLRWVPMPNEFVDGNDQVFLLLYNQTGKQAYMSQGTASRVDGQLTLPTTPEMLNGTVHGYGFVLDRLRKSASNSVFLGTFVDGVLEGQEGGTP